MMHARGNVARMRPRPLHRAYSTVAQEGRRATNDQRGGSGRSFDSREMRLLLPQDDVRETLVILYFPFFALPTLTVVIEN